MNELTSDFNNYLFEELKKKYEELIKDEFLMVPIYYFTNDEGKKFYDFKSIKREFENKLEDLENGK